jgi:hypothetical protein
LNILMSTFDSPSLAIVVFLAWCFMHDYWKNVMQARESKGKKVTLAWVPLLQRWHLTNIRQIRSPATLWYQPKFHEKMNLQTFRWTLCSFWM